MIPTLCDISGTNPPADTDGISFFPELKGQKQAKHDYLYWEFPEYGGQQAVLLGKWKAIRKNMHKGDAKWELYNLYVNPAESTDLAAVNTSVIAEIEAIVKKKHMKSGNRNWWFKNLDGD